jgi:iron complex outermembrane receptor protein
LKYVCLIVLCNFAFQAAAQYTDTVLSLPAFEVRANRLRARQIFSEKLDTLALKTPLMADLGRQLQFNSELILREYGSSGLAAASFRGQDSRATDVFWNGMKLNSGLNGTFDFNQIPVFLFSNIRVEAGAEAAGSASGGLGGAIHLSPDTTRAPFTLISGWEQYQTRYAGMRTSGNKGKTSWHSAFFIKSGLNNFLFTNRLSGLEERMDTARFTQVAGVLSGTFKAAKRHVLGLHILFAVKDQLLPRHYGMPKSTESQKEASVRAAIEDKMAWKKHQLIAGVGISAIGMRYADPRTSIDDTSTEAGFQPRVEYTYSWRNNLKISANTYGFFSQVNQDNYKAPQHLNQTVHAVSMQFLPGQNHHLEIWAKAATDDRVFVMPLPTIKYAYHINPQWALALLTGGNFLLPTANDKFWIPGGNTALKPSEGYQSEVSLQGNMKMKSGIKCNVKSLAYAGRVNRLMQWLPDSVGIWRAANQGDVMNWGGEGNVHLSYAYSKGYVYTSLGYFFNRSFLASDSLNLQRPYIPKHRANMALGGQMQHWKIDLYYNLVSERYQDKNKTLKLPGYGLMDVYLTYTFTWLKTEFHCGVYLRNLADTQYNLVFDRPLPGRLAGMQLSLIL